MTAGQVETQVSNDTGALALPGGWLPAMTRRPVRGNLERQGDKARSGLT